MERTMSISDGGAFKFPFKGIQNEKYYVEADPNFNAKVEEISLYWKEAFDNGNEQAIVELLREGGRAFLLVPWVVEQIRQWKEHEDSRSPAQLREIEAVVGETKDCASGKKVFHEKTLMLKDYDTYLETYTVLHEKRARICGDCARYQQDPYLVACFENCDFPERWERLRLMADDPKRLPSLFRSTPWLMALRFAVIDGEIWNRRKQ
jgi:hypothetical protein